MAGYSGKPLWQKLGITADTRLALVGPPLETATLLAGAPEYETTNGSASMVWLFARDVQALARLLPEAMKRLDVGAMLWVSWPKKSSPLFVDLTEDDLRRLILPTGWVDVKVCAVDDTWSGLKFLKRRANG